MKLLSTFLLIAFLFSGGLHAQTCIPVFKKTYGGTGNDEGHDIIYTSDKGSLVAGRTNSGTPGDYDALLLKLTEDGTIQWSKRIGGTADDLFTRVKRTSDNGYIVIGNTRSFGNTVPEALIIKTDATGNILWSRHFGKPGIPFKAKDIIQLSTGGYVFAANENDSTINGNAVISRLDAAGNIMWTKTFDHGNDDGVNSLVENGTVLYATGYATIDRRDGILMKLDLTNGTLLNAKKMIRIPGWEDELINIELTNEGVAFSAISYSSSGGPTSFQMKLTMFKMKSDGTVTYQRIVDVSLNSYRNEYITARSTADSGFVYALNDTTPNGFPITAQRGPTGMAEWGWALHNFDYSRVRGIDRTGNDGYLYSGYLRSSWQTGNKHKVIVFKTDINGKVTSCTQAVGGNVNNSINYSITDNFIWNNISSANPGIADIINPASVNLNFTATVVCEEQRCYYAPPIIDTCNSTFFTRYEARQYNRPWDIIHTNDGGSVMVGFYGTLSRMDPFITKLKPNGDIAWSKTVNQFGHTGFLKKLLPTADGNLLILGVSDYSIDNVGSDSTILMKVNSVTGDIIWSKHCDGDVYDIAATDDGGFVFCLNRNYGFPPIYTYLVRITASGVVTWQKEMRHWGGGLPVYRGVIYEAPYIYLGADYYNQQPTNSILLEKFNASDGTRVWENRFLISNENPQWEGFAKSGDSLVVALRLPYMNAPPFKYNFGILRADINGNSLGAYKITTPDISVLPFYMYNYVNEHMPGHFTKTADNNFVFAEQSTNSGDTSIVLTKFSGNGQLIWGRKYKNLKKEYVTSLKDFSGNLYMLGRNNLGIIDNTVATDGFLMKADSNGIVMPNGTGDCFSEPSTAVFTPLTVTNGFVTNETPLQSNDISFQDYTVYNRPVDMWARLSCSIPSSCFSLRVLGPNLVCSVADTFTYVARKNPGCQAQVLWQFDTARVRFISSTDSSVKVQFTGTGTTRILVKMNNGCRDLSDSVVVNVVRNADSLNLGADTTICENNTIVLKAGKGFKNYLWQDGSTLDSLIVSSPGLYFVTVQDSCGRVKTDSINVTVFTPPFFSAGPDRVKCNQDTLLLQATTGFINYSWSPNYNINSVSSPLVIVNPDVDTSYKVKAEIFSGCFVYDTIFVRVNRSLPVLLGKDTSFCKGESLLLNAGSSFNSYLWSTGETTASIIAANPGIYFVAAVTPEGCISRDTLNIINVYPLPAGFLPKDTTICKDETIQLKATNNFRNYQWNTGSQSAFINVQQDGVYWLQVTDANNCSGRDSVIVSSRQCIEGIFFPTAFTPDNNGKNDVYRPLVHTQLSSYRFTIYNRWGQVVFTSTEINKGWNGKLNGVVQDGNIYVWTCNYQETGKPARFEKGTFILIR